MSAVNKPYLQLGGEPEHGQAVAIVRGGKRNGEIIYLCEGEPKKGSREGGFSREEMMLINQLIDEQLKLHKTDRSMRKRQHNAEVIRRTMESGGNIQNEILNDIYKIVKSEFDRKRDVEIDIPDGSIEVIPRLEGRECGYAAAPSGSGKSYWVGKYAKQYNRLYPDNKIWLFSKVDDDTSLDGIKNLVKVDLDYQIVDDPIDATELKDSLVIFDDTDTIKDKEIRNAVNDLKNDLLETGRHNSTYVLITSHLISNYKETRTVLNESHLITVYPSSGSSHQIKYVLKNYFGLGNEDLSKLFKLNSRWISLRKVYPQLVISEHKIYLLGSCLSEI